MNELFRFSLARAPQRLPVQRQALLDPGLDYGTLLQHGGNPQEGAGAFLSRYALLPPTPRLDAASTALPQPVRDGLALLRTVDLWLAAQGNRPAPTTQPQTADRTPWFAAAAHAPGGAPTDLLSRLQSLREFLDAALIAASYRSVEGRLRADLTRLRLVLELLQLATQDPTLLRVADDVERVLRDTQLVLPAVSLRSHQAPLLARRIGFSDLYVVREEWTRYEVGEIAHIENVLARELKERKLVQLDETEQTSTQETETTASDERVSQTTDRFDLADEARREAELTLKLDGSVDTSGQYGPTQVNTHIGGSLDFSQKDAEQHATKQSHEIVSRAVTRVEQRARTVRTLRTLRRVEGTDAHTLNNESGNHVIGIYRWVDKIKTLQLFHYPNRLLLEFHVPEPGAWLRWLAATRAGTPTLAPEPLPLTLDGRPYSYAAGQAVPANLLEASDLSDSNYLAIAARYGAAGITPPPGGRSVATVLTQASDAQPATDKQPIDFYGNATLNVPTGYAAQGWTATLLSWQNRASFPNSTANIVIAVGDSAPVGISVDQNHESFDGRLSGTPGPISQGTVPVALRTDATRGFAINVEVACTPLPETQAKWRIETFDAIVQAYTEMKQRHDDELAARAIRRNATDGAIAPERARELIRDELKRAVVTLLGGAGFQGFEGLGFASDGEPSLDFAGVAMAAPVVQFFEQAFEWENLSYALYPPFWSAHARWPDLAQADATDPDLARFYRSGAARVVVSARPRFEHHVLFFLDSGQVWSGGPVPAPNDPDYLSVAEEIRQQTQAPRDGIPGESWEVRLPTNQVWLQPDGTLPANPRPTLPKPIPPATPAPPAPPTP